MNVKTFEKHRGKIISQGFQCVELRLSHASNYGFGYSRITNSIIDVVSRPSWFRSIKE